MKVAPCLYRFDFTETSLESPYTLLPLKDSAECNRLLAAKAINFRLIMFQLPKWKERSVLTQWRELSSVDVICNPKLLLSLSNTSEDAMKQLCIQILRMSC
jgi:hypothetical protein